MLPVCERLAAAGARVSIDTTKLEVARPALEAGATLVNDVSAFRVRARAGGPGGGRRGRLLPHAHAGRAAHHAGATRATRTWSPRCARSWRSGWPSRSAEGVAEERVWLDPGIGFGKTVEHNLELLRRLDEIVAIGRPVVIGTSRK